MRVEIPQFESKKDLFSYLKNNEKELTAQKKSLPILSEPFSFGCRLIKSKSDSFKEESFKGVSYKQDDSLPENEIEVEVIANVHGWCDSHMDVLIDGSAKKTLNDKGFSNQRLVYHLKDHIHNSSGIVGKDVSVSSERISLSKFNIVSDIKDAEAIIGKSIVPKRYDEKIYNLYLDNQIKQHSIGIQYVKIFLCLNSEEPEDSQYKEAWDKYYPKVINKDKIDSKGYFWAVTEYKLLEYSAVLWGASELTPTRSIGSKNIQPSKEEGTDDSRKSQNTLSKKKRTLLI